MSAPVNKTVNIYINQDAAQRALKQLQSQADTMAKTIEKGRKAGKDMTEEMEKLGKTQDKIGRLEKQISGELNPSLSQVRDNVKKLKHELDTLSEGTAEFEEASQKLKLVEAEYDRLREKVRGTAKAIAATADEGKSKWSEFWDTVKGVAVGTVLGSTIQAAFESAMGYFSGIVSGNAKLSDSMADIQKATGLTAEQVQVLNSSLSKIDTRTATGELRNIAIGLGQLGEAATAGAIASIDQIVVALGDEFGGGAQEITTALGTLRNNLADIKSADYGADMLHIGNALNVMGAAGLATAPVLVDMSNRMAGVAGTFKLTSGQLFGVAATFQELGISSERGTTAFNKLLLKMTSDTKTFAEVAGESVAEFEELMNRDMLAALVKVAEGTRNASDSNVAFGQVLSQLDADGSGASEVLSKLAGNGEMLAGKVKLAGDALKNTDSITSEFTLKNTNLAAQLAKLEKQFAGMITSRGISDFLIAAVKGAGALMNTLGALGSFISDHMIAISLWSAAVITNTVAVNGGRLATILFKVELGALIIAQRAVAASTAALSIAKALLVGNMAKVRQEIRALQAALGTNPLTLLLVAAGALVLALQAVIGKLNELTDAQKIAAEVQKSVATATLDTEDKIRKLVLIMASEISTLQQKKQALADLVALNPTYLNGLSLANFRTAEGVTMLKQYVQMLRAKAVEEGLSAKRTEIVKEMIDLQLELSKLPNDGFDWNTLGATNFRAGTLRDQIEALQGTLKYLDEASASLTIFQVQQQQTATATTAAATASTNQAAELGALQEQMAALQASKSKLHEGDTKALAEWQSQFTALQARIDAFNPEKADRAAAAAAKSTTAAATRAAHAAETAQQRHDRIMRQAEDFHEKVKAMQADITAAEESADALAIQRVKDKYAKFRHELEQFAVQYHDWLTGNKAANDTFIADLASLTAAEQKELQALVQKQFAKRSDDEYDASLKTTNAFYQQQRQDALDSYAAGALDRRQYAERIKALEYDEARSRLQIASDYAATSEKAAEQVEAFKTAALQKGIADREAAQERGSQDKLYAAQRNVATARPGSNAELDAKKALLQAQFEADTQYLDKKNELYLQKQAQLEKDTELLGKEHFREQVAKAAEVAQAMSSAVGSYFDYLNSRDKAALDKDIAANDKKKANLKKRLDAGKITQKDYDKQVAKIDADSDKRKKEMELKQFRRNKAMGIANATINVLQGVARAFSDYMWPLSGIMAALVGIAGGFQIAAIASQKPPEYAIGRRPLGQGGMASGPSHAGGGIHMIDSRTGQLVGIMEGDEAILSKKTVANNPELAGALLDASMYQGGRRISPLFQTNMPVQVNTRRATEAVAYTQMYGNGRFAPGVSSEAPPQRAQLDLPDGFIEAMLEFSEATKRPLRSYTVFNEMEAKQQQKDRLKKESSYKSGV